MDVIKEVPKIVEVVKIVEVPIIKEVVLGKSITSTPHSSVRALPVSSHRHAERSPIPSPLTI